MAETDLIRNYVDGDVIAESFAGSGLSPEEVDAAVGAIQVSRAQFVVDSIAVELVQKRAVLLMDREEAVRQLAGIDAQLAEFGSNTVSSEPEDHTLLDSGPERYRKFLGANMNHGDLQKALESEPPFVLWFTVKRFTPTVGDYSLRDWVNGHMGDIKEMYDDRSTQFIKTANLLSRHLGNRSQIDMLKEAGYIAQEEMHDGDDRRGLRIDRPGEFILYTSSYINFGVQSAIITLAIADMQRQEQTAAKPE